MMPTSFQKTARTLLLPLLALLLPLAAHAASQPPLPTQWPASATDEYLLISGGVSLYQWERYIREPHDLWWMNFIRAARIRIDQLRAQGVPASQITWMVYAPAYRTRSKQEGQNLFPLIESVKTAYGINLKYFSKASELISHINHGKPRATHKIVDFEYFGHSNRACLMFDYSNAIAGASKVWLHVNDFRQLNPDAFARDAFACSWGCHTAEEMSQAFRRTTGIRMWGAIGRSQYQTDILPTLASSSGRWSY